MSLSWGLKHRIAHVVHGHEFMTSHHVHMTRHELMSDTALQIWAQACVEFGTQKEVENSIYSLKMELWEEEKKI